MSKRCEEHQTKLSEPKFLGSMLPQYMALSVSQLVSFVTKKIRPILSKVGG